MGLAGASSELPLLYTMLAQRAGPRPQPVLPPAGGGGAAQFTVRGAGDGRGG